ncbi:MAG TPA: helix-turn-helix transcriptional regulator [Rubrobacter sp.]|nr:helix-turn-helix transcriptional regulator [Rubrobacter sp.]
MTVEGSASEGSPKQSGGPPSNDEPLTPREVEVLRLVAQGQTNQQIARNLLISTSSVKSHIRHIGEKLGVATACRRL